MQRINFVWGKPAPSLLPVANLSQAIQDILTDPAAATDALEYGDPAGPIALRRQVAKSLSAFYRTPNAADEICITAGSSQGLVTVLQVLSDPLLTKRVWLVAPCFHSACRIFEDAGFTGKLRAVPETENGIDLAYLECAMMQVELEDNPEYEGAGIKCVPQPTKPADPARKTYTHHIYLVPTFSNPSGRTVPLSHRRDLVALARRFDALIISDDIYDYLSYSAGHVADAPSLLPRLVDIDRTLPTLSTDPYAFGHTLSAGSFSKLISPGIRTGWISTSPSLARALSAAGASIAGGCPSQLGAAVVAQFLATGQLTSHIYNTLIPAYTHRRHLMATTVRETLGPLGVRIMEDSEGRTGGYFLWLRLPGQVDGRLVARTCAEQEALDILPGEAFEVIGDTTVKLSSYLRVCFSWSDEKNLVEGIRRLGRVICGLLEEFEKEKQCTGTMQSISRI
ncbi:aminotransferase [Penicillium cf. griseofulvum]|nr:aminotransferase [Penicillium cf. griseofulvum]